MIVPAKHQPNFPLDRFLSREQPGDEAIPLDVLFVGGGPAGLAGAIRLAQRVREHNANGGNLGEIEIGVLEKADNLGDHCLSGAVLNPAPFQELFPDTAMGDFPFRQEVTGERVYFLQEKGQIKLPTPPEMRNHGNWVASICEVVRWLGGQAEELGVNLFTGFPADALIADGDAIVGVKTAPSGLNRDGSPGPNHMPAGDVTARVTVLSDGTRSPLAQAWRQFDNVTAPNPQIYALGVKELWKTTKPLDAVIHTLGWPLPRDAFGGSWIYPMADDLVSLGLVVGLDYKQHSLDVHKLTQQLKQHPLVASILEGGELVEWGAKTIPEGGLHALPERLHGNGLLVCGDAAGFVNVAALKGIHYAMFSGIHAADTIFDALVADDCSAKTLSAYDQRIRESAIHDDLHRTRNMRLAFKSGFVAGGAKAWLMSVTGGRFPAGKIDSEEDAAEAKDVVAGAPFQPDGKVTFSKQDAVFRSGNATRDDLPSHLIVGEDIPAEVAEMYAHLCPAGVYEVADGKLVVNAPNCVDCKATDVLGPRWSSREGGAGPRYQKM